MDLPLIGFYVWLIFWPPHRGRANAGSQPYQPTFGFYLAMLAGFIGIVVVAVIVCFVIDLVRGGRQAVQQARGFEVIVADAQPQPETLTDPARV